MIAIFILLSTLLSGAISIYFSRHADEPIPAQSSLEGGEKIDIAPEVGEGGTDETAEQATLIAQYIILQAGDLIDGSTRQPEAIQGGCDAETTGETPVETSPETSIETTEMVETASPPEEPSTRTVRLRVMPAAASLEIAGEEYDALEAGRGLELAYGEYRIEARGSCCETHHETLLINGETEAEQAVVLQWKDGYIRLVTDRAALVWVEDATRPRSLSAGEPLLLPISFGRADTGPSQRDVALRIADRDDLQREQRRVVRVRPAESIPLAVTLHEN